MMNLQTPILLVADDADIHDPDQWRGRVAMLEADAVPGGVGEVFFDPVRHPFLTWTEDFATGLWSPDNSATAYLRTLRRDEEASQPLWPGDLDFRFRITGLAAPVERLTGRSMMAAQAVLLENLLRQGPPFSRAIAVSGTVKKEGREWCIGPVGGVKAKVFAAYEAGIRKLVVAAENEVEAGNAAADIYAQAEDDHSRGLRTHLDPEIEIAAAHIVTEVIELLTDRLGRVYPYLRWLQANKSRCDNADPFSWQQVVRARGPLAVELPEYRLPCEPAGPEQMESSAVDSLLRQAADWFLNGEVDVDGDWCVPVPATPTTWPEDADVKIWLRDSLIRLTGNRDLALADLGLLESLLHEGRLALLVHGCRERTPARLITGRLAPILQRSYPQVRLVILGSRRWLRRLEE